MKLFKVCKNLGSPLASLKAPGEDDRCGRAVISQSAWPFFMMIFLAMLVSACTSIQTSASPYDHISLTCYAADPTGQIYSDIIIPNVPGQWIYHSAEYSQTIYGPFSLVPGLVSAVTKIFVPAKSYTSILDECNEKIHAQYHDATLVNIYTIKTDNFVHDLYFTNEQINSAYPIKRLITFGDSLTDDSNDFRYISTLMRYDAAPGAYWNRTFTNGLVWADWVAGFKTYSTVGTGLNIPFENYAWGGAFSTGKRNGMVPSLADQVDSYLDYIDNNKSLNLAADIPTTLYSLLVGGNDFVYTNHSPELVAAQVAEQMTKLIARGARYFIIPTFPNIGIAPFAKTKGIGKKLTLDAQAYNNWLNKDINFNTNTIHIIRPDFAGYVMQLTSSQALNYYHFDISKACMMRGYFKIGPGHVCADPIHTLFWDGLHPNSTLACVIGQQTTDAIEVALGKPSTYKTNNENELVANCEYSYEQPR